MSLSANLFGRDSFIFKATNALGLGIPGWLDKKFGPKETEGTRLEDLSVQTSTYGADIPRLYGTISMAGNILWLEGGKLKEVVKKNKKGGKGGASTTPTKTYTYFATFALGLCEGPIAGVRRIWCSDTLLYNAGSDDLETIIASNANAKGWKLYLGSDEQQPDSRYEADVGAGNAPAFRGLAYLVFYDFELTDYANTLQASQFKVEIVQTYDTDFSSLKTKLIPYEQPFDNPSFSPKAYFVSPEQIDFYIPEWQNNYPESSVLERISVYSSGAVSRENIPVSLQPGDVPPGGDSSKEGEYWVGSRAVFAATGTFSASDGYIQRRGDVYVGLSNTGGRHLYRKGQDGQKSVEADAVCFAIDGDLTYVLNGLTVVTLDESLEPIGSFAAVIPGLIYPIARAEKTSSGLIVYDGSNNSRVYRVTANSVELVASLPYVDESFYGLSVYLSDDFLVRAYPNLSSKSLSVEWLNLNSQSIVATTLSSVIEDEMRLSGLLAAQDILVEDQDTEISGYKVASGTIRSALEPLQSAYPFDVIQSGYQVRIVSRGKSSIRSIPMDDLYAGEDGRDDVLSQSREMDSQLPNRIVVKYLDSGREYDVSQQQYQRASTASVDEMSLDLSLVLTADKAAGIAEILCYLAWLERIEFSFTLPPIYSDLEPADVVTLFDETVSYELRITETTQGVEGRTECKAVPNRAALYTSQAKGGTGVIPSGLVTLPGKSLAVLLDIPVVDETVQDDPGFVAAVTGYTAGWPGAVLIGSSDNGQTYAELQGFAGKGTFGTTNGVLTANGGTLIDLSSLKVSLISGQLESVTRDRMLSGVNYAAYGIDGRWEIVRFQNAVLQADGAYLLSGFLRGQRGTEWATGLHKESDWFVLLDDPDNAFIDLPSSALAETRLYKAVTSRQSVDDSTAQQFTYKGVNLQPLSPVYARGSRNAGSLTVTWTRRSRLSNSWWSNGVVAPLGEVSENYQVDVMSGATVVRTISSSSAAITYTAAQQQTDFGSVQSAITLRIFQLSSAVGRGRALEVTL